MNEFTTVFIFTNVARDAYFIIICPALGILIFFCYLLFKQRIHKLPDSEGEENIRNIKLPPYFFPLFLYMSGMAIFMVLYSLTAMGAPNPLFDNHEYAKLKRIYNSQQYSVAEGIVHVLHAQNVHGHEEGDIIKIGSVELEITAFIITYGYHTPISHGGALTEGTYARVFYIENPPGSVSKDTILRVDIKKQ
jgi:hypothetical protein